jgi:hypothetical protein
MISIKISASSSLRGGLAPILTLMPGLLQASGINV